MPCYSTPSGSCRAASSLTSALLLGVTPGPILTPGACAAPKSWPAGALTRDLRGESGRSAGSGASGERGDRALGGGGRCPLSRLHPPAGPAPAQAAPRLGPGHLPSCFLGLSLGQPSLPTRPASLPRTLRVLDSRPAAPCSPCPESNTPLSTPSPASFPRTQDTLEASSAADTPPETHSHHLLRRSLTPVPSASFPALPPPPSHAHSAGHGPSR